MRTHAWTTSRTSVSMASHTRHAAATDIVFSETLTEEQALNVPDQHSSSDEEVELDDMY